MITPEQMAKSGLESGEQKAVFKESLNPCLKCYTFIKYVSSGNCVKCHTENTRNRWNANKNILNERRRLARLENPEKFRNQRKKWSQLNPDKIIEYNIKHKDHRAKLTKEWIKNNPEKHKIHVKTGWQNKRARKKQAEGNINSINLNIKLKNQWNLCFWCYDSLDDTWEVEHIIPLSRGGTNLDDNIVISCRNCNAQKNNKLPEEWFKYPLCRAKRKW